MHIKPQIKETIPEPTLRRLPWYLAFVSLLNRRGIANVSSTRIAEELHVDASQIAKDLSFLNIRGKTRIGYDVATLEHQLVEFLGFKQLHNAVVIGAGSLGAALMRDSGLSQYGLNIMAGFDIDPAKIGQKIGDTVINHIDELADIARDRNVRVAILTVPFECAQNMADKCAEAGIEAIWNFTPSRISTSGNTVIQNTSIYSDLAVMFHHMQPTNENQPQ